MKSKTTIEVNGKRYDATTGAVIGVASVPSSKTGQNIDGFFRSRSAMRNVPSVTSPSTVLAAPAPQPQRPQPSRTINHAKAHAPQPVVAAREQRVPSAQPTHKPIVRHAASAPNHTKHHAPQSTRTLRRDGVRRPAPSFHKQAHTIASLQHSTPSLIIPKQSLVSIDAERLARAQSAPRSIQISHHGGQHVVQPTLTPLPVKPAPPSEPNDGGIAAPSPTPTNKPTEDIFEHALSNATNFVDIQARKHHFKKQARRHIASMTAGTLALVVIVGFAAYQNTPGLQFKVASVQAGVSTAMPNLKAAGFAYKGVRGGEGKLTIGFSKGANSYQLTQTPTNLSSGEMINTVGATNASGHPIYKTIESGGTTIYRFNNTNATWISGGTWYTVSGTSALTDSQVESLAQNV